MSGYSSNPFEQSANSSVQGDVDAIPGFYYDKEKKQYFKILSNPVNTAGTFYTPEMIKEKEFEIQRVKDVNVFTNRPTQIPTQIPTCVVTTELSLPGMVNLYQSGGMSSLNAELYNMRYQCANIRHTADMITRLSREYIHIGDLECLQEMIPNSTFTKILCMWRIRDEVPQYAQIMQVQAGMTDRVIAVRNYKKPSPVVRPKGCFIQPIFDQISCIRWAPWKDNEDQVIYVLVDPNGEEKSRVFLKNMKEHNRCDDHFCERSPKEFTLKSRMAFSCAWNETNHLISVGVRKQVQVIDSNTGARDLYKTAKSDPLTLTYSPTDPCSLFCGTRSGIVLRHDTRCGGQTHLAQLLRQGSCLSHLHVMKTDGNYLLASDMSGTIQQYDLRHSSVVNTYQGLANSHLRIPFSLDETETILTCSGADSYTSMWDVRSGKLLVRIPPPFPVTKAGIPRAVYSSNWCGGKAGSGLLLSFEDKLIIYQ